MVKMKESIIGLILLLIVACNPIRITTSESSESFHLSTYRTFGFLDEVTQAPATPPMYAEEMFLLKREISKQLQQRGLKQTVTQPDLLVNIGVMVTDKTQTRETRFGQDGPYYTGQRRYTWKSQEVPVGTYQEGSVSVHLVNPETNELVWRTDAVAVVPKKRKILEKRITEGVEKIFQTLR